MSKTISKKPKISFEKNGPINASGIKCFKNSRGEKIKTKETMMLCRCGHSKTKPFCDGTHLSIGFTDEKADDRVEDKLDQYEGEEVTILDNRGICSHAGICTSQLPNVWGESNWSDPHGASKEQIIGTIKQCPSGALSYSLNKKVYTSYHDVPEIQTSRNGPLHVRGGIVLDGVESGKGASKEHCALCRCGKSKNKPFCDGTHWYVGFKDNEDLTISAANRGYNEENEKWVEIKIKGKLSIGQIEKVQIGTKKIIITKTKNGYFAVKAQCPHQGGPLEEGKICDGKIRCPWHGFKFDLKSGQGVGNEYKAEILKIRETDGKIEVFVSEPKRSQWTVSHVMMETLIEWGIDTVFGMVGHSILGVAEAIRIQEEKGKMKYFAIRHEGAAAFACSGYAKITGKPAACLTIAGPGATNLLTGLWDAKMDRAPVLAMTGQIRSQVLGSGDFQEVDLNDAFSAVSKFSQTVLVDSDHAELASLACKNAIVERDVSHLIFPTEVQIQDAGSVGPGRPEGRVSATGIIPSEQSLKFSMNRITRSQKPLIIIGYGARDAMKEVITLAEKLNCPIITTFKAMGLIFDHHPLGGGVLGVSGTPIASILMSNSDLLIVFGASFSKHTSIDHKKPIIQVDYDRMALGKFHAVDEAVWGDVESTARLMKENLPEKFNCQNQREELKKLWASWREEKEKRAQIDNKKGINSAVIFQELSKVLSPSTVISVDVGNNTYSFGRYFECKEDQRVIMSGYLGSIGFGFPAAMGAWAAVGGKSKVVVVTGDGGLGQYLTDFTTAVKYNMDIMIVLLNNNELGKISKEQRDGEWNVWQTSLTNPSFAEFAKISGGDGVLVKKEIELKSAFKKGIVSKKPFIIEIICDPLLT